MITIYTMAYNEGVFLQFMIDHYRSRFPNCKIVLHDNYSTDNTNEIAQKNNCEIIMYDTNSKVDDQQLFILKNNCWRSAKTDWVLVCDVDELLDINEEQLKFEEMNGNTIIGSIGYNMVNMEDNFDFENIKFGSRCSPYDKKYLFNKRFIQDINYSHGAHSCNPSGVVKSSGVLYKLYHHNGYNIDYMVERHALTAERISDFNKKNGWGLQYLASPKEKREAMLNARAHVIKVIE